MDEYECVAHFNINEMLFLSFKYKKNLQLYYMNNIKFEETDKVVSSSFLVQYLQSI